MGKLSPPQHGPEETNEDTHRPKGRLKDVPLGRESKITLEEYCIDKEQAAKCY